MTFISDILAVVAGLPKPLLVLVTGALVLGECTIGLGFLVPGESGLLVASAAVTDVGFFFVLASVVALCAAIGDNIGFWLGRRYRLKMRETKVVRKLGQQHWDRAGRLLCRWGVGAVLVARFLPVVRTLMPAAAGASGMSYVRFFVSSLAGAVGWSATHVSIGWAAGASAKYIEETLGRASWILAVVLVVAGVGVWLLRRSRGRQAVVGESAGGAESEDVESAA
ncbi:DedA family protein [Saccharopolyspora phatthalungensis]|uniref:Membrane protein DedA with SNARE-associated domain n=1 Tax=Saccharopolyspora phatthalungensis TaxID=664693 RepID=A0A840QAX3_9PSEU|nr:DedA family protein [Saccharopolyspora phatthalungensis]MBB5155798.1 membrane protein DedA with SNARE-associated domain [Saccharopolyspora phatthalungensis]